MNILLAGNPNVGKTTVFNRLTKSFEHVGNWHGVTVEASSKEITYDGQLISVTDLPGLYSLDSYSKEEEISRDRLTDGSGDVIINVCDAGNLARNLCLTIQLLERGLRVILAVNMTNELDALGISIDYAKLSSALGVKVVPLDLKFDSGKLLDAALSECDTPHARRLFDYKPDSAAARLNYIDQVLTGIVTKKTDSQGLGKLDRILLNKYFALPIFGLIMLTVFFITFGQFTVGGKTFGLLGYVLKEGFSLFLNSCILSPVSTLLNGSGAVPWLVGLVTEGILSGLISVLVFLPQIVLLFYFLALLEDSGYISRVAFMTDGLFQKIGLSGRSVFTMLMGFGCSATAVLTARGLEDDMMRKKTVLLTPFMSCSARLPVYLAICSAYFAKGQIFVIMGMYFLGIAVSIMFAALAEKTKKFKSGNLSFIMEFPPYRIPTPTRTVQLLWYNAKAFIIRVGTVVFALNVAVWMLSHFTIGFAYTGNSITGSMLYSAANFISPVFAPLGFGNANAVISLLSGVIAKEAVISTMDAVGGVSAVFLGEYAGPSALAFLVFTLLYVPCIATLAAVAKELSIKWMLVSALFQLITAYVFALIFYWMGVLFVSHTGVATSIVIVLLVALALSVAVNRLISRKNSCGKCKSCNECRNGNK